VSGRDKGATVSRAYRTKRVRYNVHWSSIIRVDVIFRSPGRMSIDLRRIILGFIDNVYFIESTEKHLLGADQTVPNNLELASGPGVGGLRWRRGRLGERIICNREEVDQDWESRGGHEWKNDKYSKLSPRYI
jgi:hypothetical protein